MLLSLTSNLIRGPRRKVISMNNFHHPSMNKFLPGFDPPVS
ncbi:unnamed protein product, partial [Allacma fusca]